LAAAIAKGVAWNAGLNGSGSGRRTLVMMIAGRSGGATCVLATVGMRLMALLSRALLFPLVAKTKRALFCGKGSRGKEHLGIHCTVVRGAWEALGGTGHWLYGLAEHDHRMTADLAARFSVTISVLSQTYASGEPPSCTAAYRSIIQGAHAPLVNALQRSLDGIDILTDHRTHTTHCHWRVPHSNGGIAAGLDCERCPCSTPGLTYTALAPKGR
jgi:hypothetical protein